MLNSLQSSEAKPPPPPLGQPLPQTFHIYQHLPTLTNIDQHLPTSTTLDGSTGGTRALQSGTWSHHGAHMCPEVPPMGPLRRPFGAPLAPPTLKNLQKQIENQRFYNVHKLPLDAFGALFCSPGPPNGPPSGPKEAQRAKRVSMCDSFSAFFSLFFSLGCQMGSRRVPERPPAPKNDQKYIKNRCPHIKCVSFVVPKRAAARQKQKQAEQPKRKELQRTMHPR